VLSEFYGIVTLVGKHHATYKIDAQIDIVHQVTIHERASMQIFDDLISYKTNPQFPHQVLGPFEYSRVNLFDAACTSTYARGLLAMHTAETVAKTTIWLGP
jgi:hypothetical protein